MTNVKWGTQYLYAEPPAVVGTPIKGKAEVAYWKITDTEGGV
jgi:hypothetical protein